MMKLQNEVLEQIHLRRDYCQREQQHGLPWALNYFLRISVTRDSIGMFLSQKKYALELLDKARSLVAYTDADSAGFPTTRRSTSGYCVFLGDNLLSWLAKWQHTL
nr:ribonuclease H-like domain-containing protein [Tanacetum cinerariifolium]